jgi:hypothetical protein
MRGIITIFQCKRVVLPHIFTRYCYPIMRDIFPGDLDLYIIQHVGGFTKKPFTHLVTSRLNNNKLELVQKWTEAGKYEGATIITHKEKWPRYPHMPSFKRGVELAVTGKYDYHLWLEDDALVLDENCDKWGDIEDGYIATCNHGLIVCVAHFLTTLGFDKRILPLVQNKDIWWLGGTNFNKAGALKDNRVEARFAKEAGEKRCILKAKRARMHKNKQTNYNNVVKLINYVAPGEESLLTIDF